MEEILEILEKNSRYTDEEIAVMAGKTVEEVREAIRDYVHFYKINPEEELLVIYDDISLNPGKLRLRKKGSAGGHNGIKNIIAHLGTEKFKRIKIGVGSKPEGWDLKDFVLGRFSKEDAALMEDAFHRAEEAVELIVSDKFDKAMNLYN